MGYAVWILAFVTAFVLEVSFVGGLGYFLCRPTALATHLGSVSYSVDIAPSDAHASSIGSAVHSHTPPLYPNPSQPSAVSVPGSGSSGPPALGSSIAGDAASHGPIATYSPAPVIPGYLRDTSFKTSVLISFFITAQGSVTPKLLSSSNNDELDQLALNTVRRWTFAPARHNHIPIDSNIRLSIVFEVE